MSEQEHPEPVSQPGAIALSLAGITELFISATLYGLKIYPAAIAFGVGAIFVAIVANTVSAQARTMQIRRGIAPPPETESSRRMRQIGFYATGVFGTASVALAIIQLMGQNYLAASTFGVWALCCAVFALRFR